jgi:hypothetical protein
MQMLCTQSLGKACISCGLQHSCRTSFAFCDSDDVDFCEGPRACQCPVLRMHMFGIQVAALLEGGR